MTESTVPFGFDEAEETTDAPEGSYLFTVGAKTKGLVSKTDNPMIEWQFLLNDPEMPGRYWPVRHWTVLRGKASGMFKTVLSALGLEPDDFIAECLQNYEGGFDAKTVADFFDREVVPQLVGLPVRIQTKHVLAVDRATKEPVLDGEGNQRTNVEATSFAPAD